MRVSSIELWAYQVGHLRFYRLGWVSISGRQLALAMASTISGVLSWLLAVCDTLRWIISSKQLFVERTTLTVLQKNMLSYFCVKKDKCYEMIWGRGCFFNMSCKLAGILVSSLQYVTMCLIIFQRTSGLIRMSSMKWPLGENIYHALVSCFK